MQRNKIIFSEKELELMRDKETILMQREVIHKIVLLFSELKNQLLLDFKKEQFFKIHPLNPGEVNLTKGNNFKGLPYVVLDFPKLISKNDIFNFRTFFWWGYEINFSLHLAGESLDFYRETLIKNLDKINTHGIFLVTGENPWIPEKNDGGLVKTEELSKNILEEMVTHQDYFRLIIRSEKGPTDPDFIQYAVKELKRLWKILDN